MSDWLLPSLSAIFQRAATVTPEGRPASDVVPQTTGPDTRWGTEGSAGRKSLVQQQLRAELQWRGAIAAIQDLLTTSMNPEGQDSTQGVVLCGPFPVLSDPMLNQHLATWVFVSDALGAPYGLSLQLSADVNQADALTPVAMTSVPILNQDSLASEQFCLVLTPDYSLVLVLGQDGQGHPCFQFSFDPKITQMCWQALLLRVRLSNASYALQLNRLFQLFAPGVPDYCWVSQFTARSMAHLADAQLELTVEQAASLGGSSAPSPQSPLPTCAASVAATAESLAEGLDGEGLDVELLKAIAHEVRTPLATIRTLTRLLLRRKDLAPDVLKRLGIIDQECTEQIDRFGLIFQAAELGQSPNWGQQRLAAVPLDQMFQEGMSRWQTQASRRGLTLKLGLLEQMPLVVSDPHMLDQALTGLIDRFTRQLPSGSQLDLKVSLAGSQLKLQFSAQDGDGNPIPTSLAEASNGQPRPKSLGHLLSFQPATGSLSLNLDVTKSLFQALGGKLLIKDRAQKGEMVTVFLPLKTEH